MSTKSHVGGEPSAEGRTLPPYEGRRESADVDALSEREGAKIGGATGPARDDEMKAPERDDTDRGAVASPADEQPADQMTESEESDPGVGPAHVSGTPRGEDRSESE
jgi:hypothetical protein